jgi:hypothetical protein
MTGALAYAAAQPEVMRLVSAPVGTVTVGVVIGTAFAVRVFEADGVTPLVGEPVALTASGAGVRFGGCGAGSCTVITDASGMASGTVTALAAGAIVITAVGDSSQISASFTAVDPPVVPDQIVLVSAPAGSVFVGDVPATHFAVRITKGDGVTPVSGATVVFTAAGAAVKFGACGAASCSVLTNALGLASSSVTPLGAGWVVLAAVATTTTGSAGQVTSSFMAMVRIRTVTAVRPVEYVSAGATFGWSPQVVLADNSDAVAGAQVVWTVTTGQMTLRTGTSVADTNGVASMGVTVGPLSMSVRAFGTACAWTAVCAEFAAEGVAAGDLRVQIMSGAGQAVLANGTLGPVVVRVTDGAGHGVGGAVVQVYQTVEAGVACAGWGRCPADAVLERSQIQSISDVEGLITVAPLQRVGATEVTNMVLTAGTQGFASLALTKGW